MGGTSPLKRTGACIRPSNDNPSMPSKPSAQKPLKALKRPDLVAQEIKRLITEKNLSPGDRLPRESELQAQFEVSKGTIREALKSLEVQGLVTISTGPSGGGTIAEVPLDRTLQFMQNYLFFQEVTIDNIYAVRQFLEPELAAGAVPHLTEADFEALEHSIACCDPASSSEDMLSQRREDVNFHDILAAANPNPFLRFNCELINEMLRQLIVYGNRTPKAEHRRFGEVNANFHREIVQAARARDVEAVRTLMARHMQDAASSVKRMKGRIQGRLILDADTLHIGELAVLHDAVNHAGDMCVGLIFREQRIDFGGDLVEGFGRAILREHGQRRRQQQCQSQARCPTHILPPLWCGDAISAPEQRQRRSDTGCLFDERRVDRHAVVGPRRHRARVHRHHEAFAVGLGDLEDVAGAEIVDRDDLAHRAAIGRDAWETEQVVMIIFALAQRRQRRARDGEDGTAQRLGTAAVADLGKGRDCALIGGADRLQGQLAAPRVENGKGAEGFRAFTE